MSKLYTGSIDLTKVDKSKIKEFQKKDGTIAKFLNIALWLNDEPDNYGNHISIQQSIQKGEQKIYLGNAKEYGKNEPNDKEGDDLLF